MTPEIGPRFLSRVGSALLGPDLAQGAPLPEKQVGSSEQPQPASPAAAMPAISHLGLPTDDSDLWD